MPRGYVDKIVRYANKTRGRLLRCAVELTVALPAVVIVGMLFFVLSGGYQQLLSYLAQDHPPLIGDIQYYSESLALMSYYHAGSSAAMLACLVVMFVSIIVIITMILCAIGRAVARLLVGYGGAKSLYIYIAVGWSIIYAIIILSWSWPITMIVALALSIILIAGIFSLKRMQSGVTSDYS